MSNKGKAVSIDDLKLIIDLALKNSDGGGINVMGAANRLMNGIAGEPPSKAKDKKKAKDENK